ncbi:hypothetical protein THAOC_09257, partial [Thalassiosira oceanica]
VGKERIGLVHPCLFSVSSRFPTRTGGKGTCTIAASTRDMDRLSGLICVELMKAMKIGMVLKITTASIHFNGMLLDLGNGTLSVYQNGQRLGTLKDGLAGEYCWTCSIIFLKDTMLNCEITAPSHCFGYRKPHSAGPGRRGHHPAVTGLFICDLTSGDDDNGVRGRREVKLNPLEVVWMVTIAGGGGAAPVVDKQRVSVQASSPGSDQKGHTVPKLKSNGGGATHSRKIPERCKRIAESSVVSNKLRSPLCY